MDSNNYFIQIPPRTSLYCLICTVDPNEIRDASAKSFFHWKTLKCRFIINLMPATIIASPISNAKGSFFIITTIDFYKTEELQKIMKELKLTCSSPQPVSPRAYVECVKYTLEFYLSPTWNKVGQVQMEGYNFLKQSEFNDAMVWSIDLISKEIFPYDEIKMKLQPIFAKLPSMRLENLAIPSMIIGSFLQDPDGILDIAAFGIQRVTVIPSMRKAIITRVMKKIPVGCAFRNYSEIRRHWKNMYGYRLPKTDQGMIYYEVYFPIPNKNVERFIYPEICIRQEIIQRSSENPDILKKKFLHDLKKNMPLMLGKQIQVFAQSQQSQVKENIEKPGILNSNIFTTPLQSHSLNKLDETTRLSFSGDQSLEKRQMTTQLSPTPSISGKTSMDLKRKLNYDNLKKIHEIHDSTKKSETSISAIKIFKSDVEKSPYFQNSSTDNQKKVLINIFTPKKRKKEN